MNKYFKQMMLVFIGLFLASFYVNSLSPFMTTIGSVYGVSQKELTIIPTIMFASAFCVNFMGAKLIASLGLKKGLMIAFVLEILASTIMLISKSFLIFLIGCSFQGFGTGMLYLFLGTTLSLLPSKYQKFSLYNAFYGFGGILILPISGFVLRNKINFHYIYIVNIILFVLYLSVLFGVKDKFPETTNEFKWSYIRDVLKNKIVVFFSLGIFLYVGAEVSTTTWAGVFLEGHYKIQKATVPNILLGFWVLFTLGRAFGDILLKKYGQLKIMVIASIGTIIGILVLVSGRGVSMALLGLGIIGIMISVMYPALQGFVVQNIKREEVPEASVIMGVSNNLGTMILTYILGMSASLKVDYVFLIQILLYVYLIGVSIRFLKIK